MNASADFASRAAQVALRPGVQWSEDGTGTNAIGTALYERRPIEVHGNEAPTIARGNARTAALAGQPIVAKSWIRVLSIIQRQQAGEARKV